MCLQTNIAQFGLLSQQWKAAAPATTTTTASNSNSGNYDVVCLKWIEKYALKHPSASLYWNTLTQTVCFNSFNEITLQYIKPIFNISQYYEGAIFAFVHWRGLFPCHFSTWLSFNRSSTFRTPSSFSLYIYLTLIVPGSISPSSFSPVPQSQKQSTAQRRKRGEGRVFFGHDREREQEQDNDIFSTHSFSLSAIPLRFFP